MDILHILHSKRKPKAGGVAGEVSSPPFIPAPSLKLFSEPRARGLGSVKVTGSPDFCQTALTVK